MPTLNQYPRNVQIRAINRLIMKYGHAGTIITDAGVPEDCMVLFGSYKIGLVNGTLIQNTNYKLHIKPVGKMKFNVQPNPTTEVTVNGMLLSVVRARKIAPDGANPIVWELEASGGTIPYDTITIVNPSVVLPADNQENYTNTGTSNSKWAANFTSTAFDTIGGDDTLVGMDWEIATDNVFTTVVASVTGYTGGVTWNSGFVLNRNTNYWVRVRHTGLASGVSQWSAGHKFSLDLFYVAPITYINKPTITTPVTSGIMNNISSSTGGKFVGSSANANKWRAVLKLNAYSPVAGTGAASKSYWQISTTSDFSTILYEGDGEGNGGNEDWNGFYFSGKGVFIMPNVPNPPFPFPLLPSVTYYARGRYHSVDARVSEYSDAITFKVAA